MLRTNTKHILVFVKQINRASLVPQWQRICVCQVASVTSTRCDPTDCSLPGSSVHRTFQVRTLEWVAMPFSG